jgi:hypothetical protein
MVHHVTGQQHLPRTAPVVAQIQPGRAQHDPAPLDGLNGGGVDERAPPPDPDHQPGDRRVALLSVQPRHDIHQTTHLLTGLVEDRRPDQAGHRHDLPPHRARRGGPPGTHLGAGAHGPRGRQRRASGHEDLLEGYPAARAATTGSGVPGAGGSASGRARCQRRLSRSCPIADNWEVHRPRCLTSRPRPALTRSANAIYLEQLYPSSGPAGSQACSPRQHVSAQKATIVFASWTLSPNWRTRSPTDRPPRT